MTAVADPFTRPDAGTLGSAWTEISGVWQIVSNRCQNNTDAGGLGYYARFDTDVGSVDVFAQATVTSVQASGNSNTGVCLRQRAAANTSYQVTGRHAEDTINFWRIVAGVETAITAQTGTTDVPATWGSGDVLRGEVFGTVIRAKINGQVVGFAVDANVVDGQRCGLNGWNEIASDVIEVDTWSGGALIDDGGLVAPIIAGIGAQTARSTAASMTPTIPASVSAGQLVIAHGTVRSVTETITPPVGEGWSQLELASGNSLRTYVWAKVWGLGGQTDDTTPTFTRTGTTGAFVTVSLALNPLHSTRPWTSVAAAVAGSGQQSNAAATAATAPSVAGNWTNATVIRLFSSADDNALGTPSAGTALVYGAAAYDATDIAQAMTVAEDITVTTNTGTATVQETVLGTDANNGVTLVLTIPTAGTTVNAGGPSSAAEAGPIDASIAVNAGAPIGAAVAGGIDATISPSAGGPTAAAVAGPVDAIVAPAPPGPTAAASGAQPSVTAATSSAGPTAGAAAAGPIPSVAPRPAGPNAAASAPGAAVSTTDDAPAGGPTAAATGATAASTVAPHAGNSTADATAPGATISTTAEANATAGGPTATATAGAPSPAVAPTAGAGTAGAAGSPALVLVAAHAGSATAGATAPGATADVDASTNATAGSALAAATAPGSTPGVAPIAGAGTAGATSPGATASTPPPPPTVSPIVSVGTLTRTARAGALEGTVTGGGLTRLILSVGDLTGETP